MTEVAANGSQQQEAMCYGLGRFAAWRSRYVWRVLFISALSILTWSLLAWLAALTLIVKADIPHADVLVVLAGASNYIERTHHAARLFSEGRATRILLTNDGLQGGWSHEQQRNPFFVEREAEELQRAGVPIDRIEVMPQVLSSTYEEAELLREYIAAHGLRSVLIVTSSYHSRRALWTFRRVLRANGIEVGLNAVAPGLETPSPITWWWSERGWRIVAGEYVKLAYYRLRY